MRRVALTLVWTALVVFAIPSPAAAWWEFLEELSGPGPFRGWDIQARVLCMVRTPDIDPATGLQRIDAVTKQPLYKTEPKSVPVIGVILSACKIKPDETRRAAVDVRASFLKADGDARFANGESIDLTMIDGSMSFNLFGKHADSDYLDIAFGAGMYWFASDDFAAFRGFYLEPVRFEFHPTTAMKRRTKLSALVPVLRAGVFLFPAGFETAKFHAAPGVPAQIGRDWVFNAGISFDLEGLF